MRKILMTILSIVIVLVFIVIYYTLNGREIRKTELNNAVTSCMKNAMEMLLEEENTPKNEEEWITMFLQSLTMQIDSASELTVKILEADMEKGILSVEAVLTFHYIFGKTGSVTCYRTVILENANSITVEVGNESKESEIKTKNSNNSKNKNENEWRLTDNEHDISPWEQKVIDAGYGNVVDFGEGSYGVLTHNDGYVGNKRGGKILREYLAELNLEPQNVSGGVIDEDEDLRWYIADNIREINNSIKEW